MKPYRWILILLLGLLILGCAKARTYSLYLRYQPSKAFPSLQEKVGPTLGIASVKDERLDPLYIGIHTPLQGASSYYKSEPFPLEKAIMGSLVEVLSRQGVKTAPVFDWDGEPKTLRDVGTDSVLRIEIKKFWTEAKGAALKTNVKTSIHFVIHLGVKKEGRVFTRNVDVEKEMAVFSLSPEKAEQTVNEILTDIFDAFFSNPY